MKPFSQLHSLLCAGVRGGKGQAECEVNPCCTRLCGWRLAQSCCSLGPFPHWRCQEDGAAGLVSNGSNRPLSI
jgi:hypothetical protein